MKDSNCSAYAGLRPASSFPPSVSALTLPLSLTASVHQLPASLLPVPAPAAVPGDGLGCLPGPRPGAGTAGLRAIPEVVVPVDALAPESHRRRDQETVSIS